MNRLPVPVTLPRARIVIDQDGHLAVTIDGQPWHPPASNVTPAREGSVSLGRSDVLRVQRQIADDLGTPVLVEMVDEGQTYQPDFVVPDSYRLPDNPPATEAGQDPQAIPETSAGLGAGRYEPGEAVVITAVVQRTRVDEHGHVHFRLPAALSNRTLLVHGETSGTTIPLNQPPRRDPHRGPVDATQAPTAAAAPDPQAPFMGSNHDGRRRPAARPAPTPARSTPTATDGPTAGLAAL